jgi:hypothetical protein
MGPTGSAGSGLSGGGVQADTAPQEHVSLAQALKAGNGPSSGGGGNLTATAPPVLRTSTSSHGGSFSAGPTPRHHASFAAGSGGGGSSAVAFDIARRLASHLVTKTRDTVVPALRKASDLLRSKQDYMRQRALRQRDFTSLIADTRTREGRIIQRWCVRYLAGGFKGEYAYDLTRYLGFDPGPAFAERTRQQLRIGVPILADTMHVAPSPSPPLPLFPPGDGRGHAPSFSTAATGGGGGGGGDHHSVVTSVTAAASTASGSTPAGGGGGDAGLFSPPGVRASYEAVKSPPQGGLTIPGGPANAPVLSDAHAAAFMAELRSPVHGASGAGGSGGGGGHAAARGPTPTGAHC